MGAGGGHALNILLGEISARIAQSPRDESADLAKRRQDIDRAVGILVSLYGEGALDRARHLEKQSSVDIFARSVREKLENMAPEELASHRWPSA